MKHSLNTAQIASMLAAQISAVQAREMGGADLLEEVIKKAKEILDISIQKSPAVSGLSGGGEVLFPATEGPASKAVSSSTGPAHCAWNVRRWGDNARVLDGAGRVIATVPDYAADAIVEAHNGAMHDVAAAQSSVRAPQQHLRLIA